MTIELKEEEVTLIRHLVRHRIEELGPEIHHTRTPDYHDDLKDERVKLRAIQERLARLD